MDDLPNTEPQTNIQSVEQQRNTELEYPSFTKQTDMNFTSELNIPTDTPVTLENQLSGLESTEVIDTEGIQKGIPSTKPSASINTTTTQPPPSTTIMIQSTSTPSTTVNTAIETSSAVTEESAAVSSEVKTINMPASNTNNLQ